MPYALMSLCRKLASLSLYWELSTVLPCTCCTMEMHIAMVTIKDNRGPNATPIAHHFDNGSSFCATTM